MPKVKYKASFDKFVDSLSPEQIVFLGSIIEQDIEKKDFVLLDQLASLMYQKIQNLDMDNLHKKTHEKFSETIIEN